MSKAASFTDADSSCAGNDFVPIRPGMFCEPDKEGGIDLIGSRCRACGQAAFPARSSCPGCFDTRVEPCNLGRAGIVQSFTVVHQAPPGYQGPVPYVLALVCISDKVNVLTHLVGKPVDEWRLGDAVSACGLPLQRDGVIVTAYAFRPNTPAESLQ
jgi:hypothetical protein